METAARIVDRTWLRPLATLLFVVILATIFSPRDEGFPIFWRANNLANVMRQISDIGILAMGMTLVIISGGIDLSVGSLLALSCTVFARVFSQTDAPWSPWAGVALALAMTTAFGFAPARCCQTGARVLRVASRGLPY